MNRFLYTLALQWRLDLRNKDVLLLYYLVPFLFFALMGGVYLSLDPGAKETILPSLTLFGCAMGAFLGGPVPICSLFGGPIKKAYRVGGVPLGAITLIHCLSAFLHLFTLCILFLITGPIFLGAARPAHLGRYLLSLIFFLAVVVAIAAALGLWVKGSARLTMFSQLLFLPSILFSGILMPAQFLPKALVYLGKLLPTTYGFSLLKGESSVEVLLPLALIFLIALALSFWGYRRQLKAEE